MSFIDYDQLTILNNADCSLYIQTPYINKNKKKSNNFCDFIKYIDSSQKYNYSCIYDSENENDIMTFNITFTSSLIDFVTVCTNLHHNQYNNIITNIDDNNYNYINVESEKQISIDLSDDKLISFLNSSLNIFEMKNYTVFSRQMTGELHFDTLSINTNILGTNYIYIGPLFQKEIPFGYIIDQYYDSKMNSTFDNVYKYILIGYLTSFDTINLKKYYTGSIYIFPENVQSIASLSDANNVYPVTIEINIINNSNFIIKQLIINANNNLIFGKYLIPKSTILSTCSIAPKIVVNNGVYRLSSSNYDTCIKLDITIKKDFDSINSNSMFNKVNEYKQPLLITFNNRDISKMNTIQITDKKYYYYLNNMKVLISDDLILNTDLHTNLYLNINDTININITNNNNNDVIAIKSDNYTIVMTNNSNTFMINFNAYFKQIQYINGTYSFTITINGNKNYYFSYHIDWITAQDILNSYKHQRLLAYWSQVQEYYDNNNNVQSSINNSSIYIFGFIIICLIVMISSILLYLYRQMLIKKQSHITNIVSMYSIE